MTVTNRAGASIAGGQYGIVAGGGGSSVFNAGTISGGSAAIQFAGTGNTLTLAQGSAITGNVLGTGSDIFQLGGTGAATFDVSSLDPAAQYRGFGTFNKIDSSVWTLTGTSTYAGPVNVNGGTLAVNGDITSTIGVTVNTGGTLGGNGIVGDTTIKAGGALAPGNSIGALTVSGSLTMTAASTYLVQISGATSDRTIVAGTATIAGRVVVDPLARLGATTTYTILNAGTLSGTFDGVTLAGNYARNARLSYLGNDVLLTLDPGLLSPILSGTANGNQNNVAAAIDNALINGATMPAGFNALFGLSGNTLLNALYASLRRNCRWFAADHVRCDDPVHGRADRSVRWQDAGIRCLLRAVRRNLPNRVMRAPTPTTASRAAGANATLTLRSIARRRRWPLPSRNAGACGQQVTAVRKPPTAMPASDRTPRPRASSGPLSVPTIASRPIRSRALRWRAAAPTSPSPMAARAAPTCSRPVHSFVTMSGRPTSPQRSPTAGRTSPPIAPSTSPVSISCGPSSTPTRGRAASKAATASSRRCIGITPYAAGQFTTFDLPAYAEQALSGANTFALSYGAKSVTASRSELGVRTDRSWAMPDAILTLRGRVAWAHDFNPDRNIAATFQTLPGASFVVNGAAQAHDAALTTASAEMKWLNGFSLAATFEGEFSDVTESYAGKGVVRYAW